MYKYVFVEAWRIMQRRMLYFKKFVSSRVSTSRYFAFRCINVDWQRCLAQCLAESLKKPLRYFNTWNSG